MLMTFMNKKEAQITKPFSDINKQNLHSAASKWFRLLQNKPIYCTEKDYTI